MDKQALTQAVRNGVIRKISEAGQKIIGVATSARHVHLCATDIEKLFGAPLSNMRPLSQPGQYACNEQVSIIGPKGKIEKVRILGPARPQTQVEISATDGLKIGINAPVRMSGEIKGSPGCVLSGPKGDVILTCGVIIAARHIHFSAEQAAQYGVSDKQSVSVKSEGERATIFENVVVRVNPEFEMEMHIDTDEANAAGIKSGDVLTIVSGTKNAPNPSANGTAIIVASAVPEPAAAQKHLEKLLPDGADVFCLLGNLFNQPDCRMLEVADTKRLLSCIEQKSELIFLAPRVSMIYDMAQGNDRCDICSAVMRFALWGRKVTLLLDFEPPKFAKNSFFEKLSDAIKSLESMGIKIETYNMPGAKTQAADLITESDVVAAASEKRDIFAAKNAVITPLAKDRASELKVNIFVAD